MQASYVCSRRSADERARQIFLQQVIKTLTHVISFASAPRILFESVLCNRRRVLVCRIVSVCVAKSLSFPGLCFFEYV